MQRLAAKVKIGAAQWRGYPPEEIRESRLFAEQPKTEHMEAAFGEFIVKDRDFRVLTLPKGKWEEGAEARAQHQEEVERMRVENLKTIVGEAGRRKPRATAQVPPSLIEGKTDLDWDVEREPGEKAKDRKFKHMTLANPPTETQSQTQMTCNPRPGC
jgi:hypothetical protein